MAGRRGPGRMIHMQLRMLVVQNWATTQQKTMPMNRHRELTKRSDLMVHHSTSDGLRFLPTKLFIRRWWYGLGGMTHADVHWWPGVDTDARRSVQKVASSQL